jgi:glutamyl-Q tRNA(Asp) synthetase
MLNQICNLSLLKAMSTASINLCANYVGRFAPSPTGPLHFGSLIAAVASYCDAKSNNGKWLVRMEDVDKPREMAGAADDMLRTLDAFGFEWDEPVIYQSQRSKIYEEYLQKLNRNGFIYSCSCSRKEIADSAINSGIDGAIYPKTCFNKMLSNSTRGNHASASRMDAASWRINVDDAQIITFKDAIQGRVSQQLSRDVGDFILKRKDGLFAYQLAVVVDDFKQAVTHVVRGADLLDSTPRQIYLQQVLGFATPNYAHVPVAINAQGEKLSKQTLATAIAPQAALVLVFQALQFLGQHPPPAIKNATLGEMWRWAITNWHLDKVPKTHTLRQPEST